AQDPAAASAQRPGSWPTGAGGAGAPGAGAAGPGPGAADQARRPGGWPTASAPGSGPVRAATPPPATAPAAPQSAAAPQGGPGGQAAPDGGQSMAQGAVQVRNMWPDILEAVKNRRRFTWILLSQNAQVAGFDGTTLQLGFPNAGARDNFASSGSEEVLKQILAERFNAQWRIEAVIAPPGGGASGPGGGGGRPAPQYQP
ncbi:DNA polymerase III subunit gamma/tau, partial [Streptomyces sp. NRRL F-2295]